MAEEHLSDQRMTYLHAFSEITTDSTAYAQSGTFYFAIDFSCTKQVEKFKVDYRLDEMPENSHITFLNGEYRLAAERYSDILGIKRRVFGGIDDDDIKSDQLVDIPGNSRHMAWLKVNLSRKLLNSNSATKCDISESLGTDLLAGNDTSLDNKTKASPNLQPDLLGNWHKEVILSIKANFSFHVFTTVMPTEFRSYTLKLNSIYRKAFDWQNTACNQPPYPGLYIASDTNFPLIRSDIEFAQSDLSGSSISTIKSYLKIGDRGLLTTSNTFDEFCAKIIKIQKDQ